MKKLAFISITSILLGLTGCVQTFEEHERRENAQNTIVEQVTHDGVAFDIKMVPYDFWASYDRSADGLIDMNATLLSGLDYGSPSVYVSRVDGTKMTKRNEHFARKIAESRCVAHPEFRRETVFGAAVSLDDGVWKFMELCT